jgi:hypothetical protein
MALTSHLLHRATDIRCPCCGSAEVRRSARKNFFEAALLVFLLTRPFRCENCCHRFYALVFRKRALAPPPKPRPDLQQDYPALVYGRGKDEEPFQEETSVRVLSFRSGFITLATKVEPGQPLVLMNLVTGEDQLCHATFVGEHLGRKVIGVRFCRFQFECIERPAYWKSNAPTLELFCERQLSSVLPRVAQPPPFPHQ